MAMEDELFLDFDSEETVKEEPKQEEKPSIPADAVKEIVREVVQSSPQPTQPQTPTEQQFPDDVQIAQLEQELNRIEDELKSKSPDDPELVKLYARKTQVEQRLAVLKEVAPVKKQLMLTTAIAALSGRIPFAVDDVMRAVSGELARLGDKRAQVENEMRRLIVEALQANPLVLEPNTYPTTIQRLTEEAKRYIGGKLIEYGLVDAPYDPAQIEQRAKTNEMKERAVSMYRSLIAAGFTDEEAKSIVKEALADVQG